MLKKIISEDLNVIGVGLVMLLALVPYLNKDQVKIVIPLLVKLGDDHFTKRYCAKILSALASHQKIQQLHIRQTFNRINRELSAEAILCCAHTDFLDALIAILPLLSRKRIAIALKKMVRVATALRHNDVYVGEIEKCFHALAEYLSPEQIAALGNDVQDGLESGDVEQCRSALMKLFAIGRYLSAMQTETLLLSLKRALVNSDEGIVMLATHTLSEIQFNIEQVADMFPMLINYLTHPRFRQRVIVYEVLGAMADRLSPQQVSQLLSASAQHGNSRTVQLLSQLIMLGKCSLKQLNAIQFPDRFNLRLEWLKLFAGRFEAAVKLSKQPSFAGSGLSLFQPLQSQQAILATPAEVARSKFVF